MDCSSVRLLYRYMDAPARNIKSLTRVALRFSVFVTNFTAVQTLVFVLLGRNSSEKNTGKALLVLFV